MGTRLDVWKPQTNEKRDESPETVARRADILVRKAKDLRARKLFIERRATKRDSGDFDQTKGKCQFCEEPTTREYCSITCERNAAFADLPLKFESK